MNDYQVALSTASKQYGKLLGAAIKQGQARAFYMNKKEQVFLTDFMDYSKLINGLKQYGATGTAPAGFSL